MTALGFVGLTLAAVAVAYLLRDPGGLRWHLRHPTCRRCPSCQSTWEPRYMYRMQGGVCHDCFHPELFLDDEEAS